MKFESTTDPNTIVGKTLELFSNEKLYNNVNLVM